MPTSLIKKDAREGKGTVKSLEKKWDKAKDASKKSTGKDDDWALTNYIYQKEKKAANVELNAAMRLLANSAEQAIREAINAAPHQTLNKPFPIVTHFNGVSVPFLCLIQKVPTASEQMRGVMSKAYLTTVKWGLLIKGHEKSWIADQYVLDGKNNLKPNGLPKSISQQEAEEFFHTCGVPVPHHQ